MYELRKRFSKNHQTDWELVSLSNPLQVLWLLVLLPTLAVSALEASGWWPCRGKRRWTRSCAGPLLVGGWSGRASPQGSSCDPWTPAGRAGWRWMRGCRRLTGTLRMKAEKEDFYLAVTSSSSPPPCVLPLTHLAAAIRQQVGTARSGHAPLLSFLPLQPFLPLHVLC